MIDETPSQEATDAARHVTSVTPEELASVDLNKPIGGSRAFSTRELGNLFRQAALAAEKEGSAIEGLVYGLLQSLCDMHFKPGDRAEPFGPLFVLPDGRRSIIPSDIPGPLNEALAGCIGSLSHPVLRARIADIVWLNSRKLATCGLEAIGAYCASVADLRAGNLERRSETGDLTDHDVIKRLRRACQIAILTSGRTGLPLPLQQSVRTAREDAFQRKYLHGFLQSSDLDLDFSISPSADVAKQAEDLFDGLPSLKDTHSALALLERASRAFRDARDSENEMRLTIKAAECCVSRADTLTHAPMLESHWLTRAIAGYGRVRAKKERRNELRKRLIDVQARTLDEFTPISHSTNIGDIIKGVEEEVSGKPLASAFFSFVLASRSPSPADLIANALDAIKEAPLSSLFSTSILDQGGKVKLQVPGRSGADPAEQDAGLRFKIVQHENIRRSLLTASAIRPARAIINAEHGITTELLLPLLQESPFVPPGYEQVFAQGFARWFGGDAISATSILVPQLENSLRYVLINAGEDVTTMKSDGTQEDRSITSLFEAMREQIVGVLGEEIAYEIENLFLLRGGPGIRHAIAHGQISTGRFFSDDAEYACWFLLHLCFLPLLPQWTAIEASLVSA